MPHLRPDPRPKTLGACGPSGFWPRVWPQMRLRVCLRKILWGALNLLPREQIENSRNFPREQFHHTAPSSFQQIVPHLSAFYVVSLQCAIAARLIKIKTAVGTVRQCQCSAVTNTDMKLTLAIYYCLFLPTLQDTGILISLILCYQDQ